MDRCNNSFPETLVLVGRCSLWDWSLCFRSLTISHDKMATSSTPTSDELKRSIYVGNIPYQACCVSRMLSEGFLLVQFNYVQRSLVYTHCLVNLLMLYSSSQNNLQFNFVILTNFLIAIKMFISNFNFVIVYVYLWFYFFNRIRWALKFCFKYLA